MKIARKKNATAKLHIATPKFPNKIIGLRPKRDKTKIEQAVAIS
jgi:hypothetical protein